MAEIIFKERIAQMQTLDHKLILGINFKRRESSRGEMVQCDMKDSRWC